eukprot:4739080-Heterocapsa_arctica.AAC.1
MRDLPRMASLNSRIPRTTAACSTRAMQCSALLHASSSSGPITAATAILRPDSGSKRSAAMDGGRPSPSLPSDAMMIGGRGSPRMRTFLGWMTCSVSSRYSSALLSVWLRDHGCERLLATAADSAIHSSKQETQHSTHLARLSGCTGVFLEVLLEKVLGLGEESCTGDQGDLTRRERILNGVREAQEVGSSVRSVCLGTARGRPMRRKSALTYRCPRPLAAARSCRVTSS